MRVLVALVLLFAVFGCCYGVLPGVKTAVMQKGFDYASSVGLQYLRKHLAATTVHVPNQSGEKDSIEWSISNIAITAISIPSASVTVDSGKGLTIRTSAMSATLTADWSGREKVWPHPKAHGSARATISSTSASTVLEFAVRNGRPALTAADTSVSIGGFDLHFSGSHLDFILNLLKDVFGHKIKDLAAKSIASEINNEVDNGLNALIQTLPDETNTGDGISKIDYSLVSQEIFTATYMTLGAKAEFYSISKPTEAPFSPPKLPDASSSSSGMVQVMVSDYFPNTAAYVYFKAGVLAATITADMIPATSPVNFNTSTWGPLIPQLPKMYPGWLMKAQAAASVAPEITFSLQTGADLVSKIAVEMFVISPTNNTAYPAFTLDLTLKGDVEVSVSGNNIVGKVTNYSIQVTLAKSEIGTFDTTNIQGIIMFAAQEVLVPQINLYLAHGIPIPAVEKVTLVHPSISVSDRYAVIVADVHYPPPSA